MENSDLLTNTNDKLWNLFGYFQGVLSFKCIFGQRINEKEFHNGKYLIIS